MQCKRKPREIEQGNAIEGKQQKRAQGSPKTKQNKNKTQQFQNQCRSACTVKYLNIQNITYLLFGPRILVVSDYVAYLKPWLCLGEVTIVDMSAL